MNPPKIAHISQTSVLAWLCTKERSYKTKETTNDMHEILNKNNEIKKYSK